MLRPLKNSLHRNQLFKVYGVLLESILNKLQVSKPRTEAKNKLHTAFKTAHGVDSLTKLSNTSLSAYIDSIKAYFAVEHGVYIRAAREPANVEQLTLTQYLKIMNNPNQETIFNQLETLYNFHSHRERKRFLCDLTNTPHTSGLVDDERLLSEIKHWINSN